MFFFSKVRFRSVVVDGGGGAVVVVVGGLVAISAPARCGA